MTPETRHLSEEDVTPEETAVETQETQLRSEELQARLDHLRQNLRTMAEHEQAYVTMVEDNGSIPPEYYDHLQALVEASEETYNMATDAMTELPAALQDDIKTIQDEIRDVHSTVRRVEQEFQEAKRQPEVDFNSPEFSRLREEVIEASEAESRMHSRRNDLVEAIGKEYDRFPQDIQFDDEWESRHRLLRRALDERGNNFSSNTAELPAASPS